MALVNRFEYLTFYLKQICFKNQVHKRFEMAIVNGVRIIDILFETNMF